MSSDQLSASPSWSESESTLNDGLDALRNRYRRRLLIALLDHETLDADSTQVTADMTVEYEAVDVSSIKMIHTHLPKLDKMGFIEWTRETNEVSTGSQFEDIRPLLELLRDNADKLPGDSL